MCLFLFDLMFGGVHSCCCCVGGQLTAAGLGIRSILITVSHLYFIMSTQLCPSVCAKKQRVPQGLRESLQYSVRRYCV